MERANPRAIGEFEISQMSGPMAGALQPSGPISPMQSMQPPLPPAAETPPERKPGPYAWVGTTEWLLKYREHLIGQIQSGRELQVILWDLLLITVIPTAIYGLMTGFATGQWVRMVTNPIKLPLMLFLTTCLCMPTLYIFSSYLGGRRTFLQTAALAFTSTAIFGTVLAAFAPITWFLTFSAPNSYHLHVAVNVIVLGIAGFVGVIFLLQATRRIHEATSDVARQISFLWSWIVLYGLVGAQMGYMLRPFFSDRSDWIHTRMPGEETVFQAIAGVFRAAFGL